MPLAHPPGTDVLSDVLGIVRIACSVGMRARGRAPWAVAVQPVEGVGFYIVETGALWIDGPDLPATRLVEGDIALVLHRSPHRLCDDLRTVARPWQALSGGAHLLPHETVTIGGRGATTGIVIGWGVAGDPLDHPLLSTLPPLLHLRRQQVLEAPGLAGAIELLRHEVAELRPGGIAVVQRLADVFLVQAVRAYVQAHPTAGGWMRAVADPGIGRALRAVHAEPAVGWTVARLAKRAGMSRSGFHARFGELVGQSPMQYLTAWRLRLAAERLRSEDISLAELAAATGYGSVVAFSRAFRRWTGVPPGAFRRRRLGETVTAPVSPVSRARRSR